MVRYSTSVGVAHHWTLAFAAHISSNKVLHIFDVLCDALFPYEHTKTQMTFFYTL